MKASINSRVVSLIAQASPRDIGSIGPNDHLVEDLEFDALELAELVALLQQDFRVRARGVCEPGCLTVSQIVHAIEQETRRHAA